MINSQNCLATIIRMWIQDIHRELRCILHAIQSMMFEKLTIEAHNKKVCLTSREEYEDVQKDKEQEPRENPCFSS